MSVIDPFMEGARSGGAPLTDLQELAMLHHDLGGALQGLVGGIGQIDASALASDARQQFERIAAAARTLDRLVSALFGEMPDGVAVGQGLEVAPFLEEVGRRYAGEACARGLEFRIETESDLPEVLRLDPMLFARVIDNLVGNALRFSGAGAIRLEVGRDPEGRIVWRVLDEGPGIWPDPLGRPPRPATGPASDGSRHRLGLEIARSLTERLGGEIALANRPTGGLEALLRFPVELAGAGSSPPHPAAPDLGGLRVLLAEDNPTNQMVASQMLRALNAEVTICADGVEALERFDQVPVDLVVVDIEMPRLSGLDVIRAIRARSDARAEVPIVALTAYAMREHRERIAAAGANGLISKPITSVEALRRGLVAHLKPPVRREAGPALGWDDAGPVIDTAIFVALSEAIGPETMAELLDKVIADLLAAQQDLAGALEALDRGSIRSASHILISVAGALGAVRLQTCARMLNNAAASDAVDGLADGVRRCIAEIDAAVAFARARRETS